MTYEDQRQLMADQLEKQVLMAAEALDLHYPEWHHAIAVVDLELSDTRFCILGQLGQQRGDYSYGEMMDNLRSMAGEAEVDRFYQAFDISDDIEDQYDDAWQDLNRFWRRQIKQRLG